MGSLFSLIATLYSTHAGVSAIHYLFIRYAVQYFGLCFVLVVGARVICGHFSGDTNKIRTNH